jgi:hypothetical protein
MGMRNARTVSGVRTDKPDGRPSAMFCRRHRDRRGAFGSALGWLLCVGVFCLRADAQERPYIGFAYPAGGQQGTTVRVRLGGQGLDGVRSAMITGAGVSARLTEVFWRLNNEEKQLLEEQLHDLKQAATNVASTATSQPAVMTEAQPMMAAAIPPGGSEGTAVESAVGERVDRIERRLREYVQTPACPAIAALAFLEVTIASDAAPGPRELRLISSRGISNPLTFEVGSWSEHVLPPMRTAVLPVLGKEAAALRKRPPAEAEVEVQLPQTLNGQIAPGEVNRYRFEARRGQRLVMATRARSLIPYIADAVPGWAQPVLTFHDPDGHEVAGAADTGFQPDPVLFFEVPRDGQYVLAIHDSLYRGREDFVYRVDLGERPWITSVFPLGGRVGEPITVDCAGWNIDGAERLLPPPDAAPGQYWIAVRRGIESNRIPFVLDTWPECLERGPNNDLSQAQPLALPVVVHGRIETPGDIDVFRFSGASNQTVVAEVQARQLNSQLDSLLELTDSRGRSLALNDDCDTLPAGLNTHHADSYLRLRLPADGDYYLRIGDTGRHGGPDFGYRLRLSEPRSDFALWAVPSSVSLRGKSGAAITLHVQRLDGFAGPIKVRLDNPPPGFSAAPVMIASTQSVARITIKTDTVATEGPVRLTFVGTARSAEREIVRKAVPAEDRMQAFLWRHLVPSEDLWAAVFDPNERESFRRVAQVRSARAAGTNAPATAPPAPAPQPALPAGTTNAATGTNALAASTAGQPKFTAQQVARRVRQLERLFEEGLLTESFFTARIAECEAGR